MWIGAGTADLYAEKLEPLEDAPATAAVEWLIENARGFPNVAEIRDAYLAAGGDLYDPGRNMSPGEERRDLTADERAEVRAIQREIRERLEDWHRRLTRSLGADTVEARTTTEGSEP